MTEIVLKNRTNSPLDVSLRRGRGRLAAGATGTFERKNISSGWLEAAVSRHVVSVVEEDINPPTDDRAKLVREARALGIKVKKDWTIDQIVEAMTR